MLTKVDHSFVWIYLAINLTTLLLRAERYRTVLHAMEGRSPTFPQMLVVTGIRNALVDFLPARLGELSYFYVLNRFGVRLLTGISSFGLCIVFDLFVLGVFVSLFLVDQLLGPMISMVVGILLLGSGLWGIGQFDRILSFIIEFLKKGESLKRARRWLIDKLAVIAEELARVDSPRVLAKIFVLTAVLRAGKYVSLYVLLLGVVAQWGFGIDDIAPAASMVAFVFAEGAASLPISGIMSFGAYEGAWAAVFGLACATCAEIPVMTVSFAVHLITQVVGYTVGLLSLIVFFLFVLRAKRAG